VLRYLNISDEEEEELAGKKNIGENKKTRDFRKSLEIYTPFKGAKDQRFTNNLEILVGGFSSVKEERKIDEPGHENPPKTQESFMTTMAVKGSCEESKSITQQLMSVDTSEIKKLSTPNKRSSMSQQDEREKEFYIEPDLMAYTNPVIGEQSAKLEEDDFEHIDM
jgi:hypothetical protein